MLLLKVLGLKSLHILFHHLSPFWEHFMRAVYLWIIPCVEAICRSAPRSPLKAERAERDYKSRWLPRTCRMPWRSSEEPKPSGNRPCSSSVRLRSFSWDMWGTGVDTQGLEAPVSHLWIHGETVDRDQPDVRMQIGQKKRRRRPTNKKLRNKITKKGANTGKGFLSGAKGTGLVSYQCW